MLIYHYPYEYKRVRSESGFVSARVTWIAEHTLRVESWNATKLRLRCRLSITHVCQVTLEVCDSSHT